ncbi:MAG: hypothetical protein AAF578_00370 [Pseudomonadota bacterium]
MPITTASATSFKQKMLTDVGLGVGGDAHRIALYTSAANLDATTTAYTASNEATGTGYVARGLALTNNGVTVSGTTALADFADVTWSSSTIGAAGCLIFNETDADAAVQVHSFGGTVNSINGDFTITFPTADVANAIIRIV